MEKAKISGHSCVMEKRKRNRKKTYSKPAITKINLKTKETILGFCKTVQNTAQPMGTAPCVVANCFTSNGS